MYSHFPWSRMIGWTDVAYPFCCVCYCQEKVLIKEKKRESININICMNKCLFVFHDLYDLFCNRFDEGPERKK